MDDLYTKDLSSYTASTKKETVDITWSILLAVEGFNAEKDNLLSRLAELQTNLELAVSEKGSLRQTHKELISEAEALKAHLDEYSEKLVTMEDEKQESKAVPVGIAERLEALPKQNKMMEK